MIAHTCECHKLNFICKLTSRLKSLFLKRAILIFFLTGNERTQVKQLPSIRPILDYFQTVSSVYTVTLFFRNIVFCVWFTLQCLNIINLDIVVLKKYMSIDGKYKKVNGHVIFQF